MPTPRVTIDELPEQTVPVDSNLVIVHDAGVTKKMTLETLKSTATTVSTAPAFVGQLAVVGVIGYIAVGTAAAADWKQIT